MKEPSDSLERLVSRYLDDECSPEERRQLQGLLRRDGEAEAVYEETSALDREVGLALRKAVSGPVVRRPVPRLWTRVGRLVAVGMAACLGLLAWLEPMTRDAEQAAPQARPPIVASWFAPAPEARDMLTEELAGGDRPMLKLDNSDRNWIVVPGDKPGEFLVVEVKRLKTRTIPIQQDF